MLLIFFTSLSIGDRLDIVAIIYGSGMPVWGDTYERPQVCDLRSVIFRRAPWLRYDTRFIWNVTARAIVIFFDG